MSDLLERLRAARDAYKSQWGVGGIYREAADTIEAQAVEIERLKAEMLREHEDHVEVNLDAASVVQENRALQTELERLRKDAARWQFFRNTRHEAEVLEEAIDAAMEKRA